MMSEHKMVEHALTWLVAVAGAAMLALALDNIPILDAALTELVKWVLQ